MDANQKDESSRYGAHRQEDDENGDEVLLVKSVTFGDGGFAHGVCVEEVVGGVDQPNDDTHEDKSLG